MTLSEKEWNEVLRQLEAHGVHAHPAKRSANKFWNDRIMQIRSRPLGPRYWFWLLAVALGTFLGLWFAY